MQRIDSINARPNLNGQGKQGFHDNADLSGQDATYLTPKWCNTIQEELANVIEGFGKALDTNSNTQMLEVLSNFTNEITQLCHRISDIENRPKLEDIQVGDIFITMNTFNSSDEVRAHKGYGVWETVGNGHALVTRGHDNSRPDWMRYLANTGGEDSHQLSIDEMPSHSHEVNGVLDAHNSGNYKWRRTGFGGAFSQDDIPDQTGYWMSENTGGGHGHNNIQCSIVIGVWRRVG